MNTGREGRRIGVMGGTFDPVHHGHLVAASEVAHIFELDEVIFVPTGKPWQKEGREEMMGFNILQSTRPHTVAFALHDSPVGQLAWIGEKFQEWTDPASPTPEDAVGLDTLLTNVSLYWFTATAGSSANLYYEVARDPGAYAPRPRVEAPVAVLVATGSDITIRRFAERDLNVVRWTEVQRGGNFQPLEQPRLLAADVREFFAQLT
jgi:cytidyltransferase-like protein